jgi:DNA transposition AAA+ family ATPase|nr:MAG TPA: repressor protein CI [Caudoviricetes sp.]
MVMDLEKLNAFIRESGLKQKYISQISGISEVALSKILNNKKKCEINEYLAICAVLGQPFEKFIVETDKKVR